LWDVLDEVRKERKILMVLMDTDVDEYINFDMTEIDMLTFRDRTDLPADIKYACEQKLKFRLQLAQNVSIFRLDYMLRVMRKVFNGKYSISDPSGFKLKLKQLKKNERAKEKLKRVGSASSFGTESQFSKSRGRQSSVSGMSATDGASSADGGGDEGEVKEAEEKGDEDEDQEKKRKNLVMDELVGLFGGIKENIETKGTDSLRAVRALCDAGDADWDHGIDVTSKVSLPT